MYAYGIQGGGIRIKDATANPGDVATGMIFYNNDGRQIGSGSFIKEKSVVAINNGLYNIYSLYSYGINYDENTGELSTPNSFENTGFVSYTQHERSAKCKLPISEDKIILITGWKVNGIRTTLQLPIGNIYPGRNMEIGYGANPDKFTIYWQSYENTCYIHTEYNLLCGILRVPQSNQCM